MNKPEIGSIGVQELKQRLDKNPDLYVIDVREPHERQAIRIPGTLHIPKDEICARIEEQIPSHSSPIYLHCRSGMRSLYAAQALLDMGYEEVYNVEGGIIEWEARGYRVEKD